ncbi:CHRD domain-containing protein [Streptomyces sp. NPDC003691]
MPTTPIPPVPTTPIPTMPTMPDPDPRPATVLPAPAPVRPRSGCHRARPAAVSAALLVTALTGLTGCGGTPAADTGAGRATAPATVTQQRPQATGPGTSLISRLGGGQGAGAVALITSEGNRIVFSLTWNGFAAPRSATLLGSDARPVAELLRGSLPEGVRSVVGRTTVTDTALAERLRSRPGDFAVSLAAEGLPGGTLSGAVAASPTPVDPLGTVPAGSLRALADGRQEFDDGGSRAQGDPDAGTTVSLTPGNGTLGYSLAWVNLEPPTAAHIHRGALGRTGPVAVPLFTDPLPPGLIAVSGAVPVAAPAVLRELAAAPGGFYADTHTRSFPRGAVRGQLFR